MCDILVPDCQDYMDMDMDDELEWDSHEDMKFCSYCFDTKEPLAVYQTHYMYTLEGSVECPKLKRDGCPKCSDTGDKAHVAERCCKMRIRKRTFMKKAKNTQSLRVQLLKRLTAQSMKNDVLMLTKNAQKKLASCL